MDFKEFKQIIADRCKAENACDTEFTKLLASESFPELFAVLKNNIGCVFNHNILNAEILLPVKEAANASDIWVNESTSTGYLFADSATVEAWGSATVRASGSATVRASGSATVEAWGSATVEAWGSATVEAWGSATVRAWGNATVRAWGNATVRASDNATVRAWGNATVEASDNATVRAWGNATVEAWGNAFISSYALIECKLSEKAIYRNTQNNTITVLDNAYTVITLKPE